MGDVQLAHGVVAEACRLTASSSPLVIIASLTSPDCNRLATIWTE